MTDFESKQVEAAVAAVFPYYVIYRDDVNQPMLDGVEIAMEARVVR